MRPTLSVAVGVIAASTAIALYLSTTSSVAAPTPRAPDPEPSPDLEPAVVRADVGADAGSGTGSVRSEASLPPGRRAIPGDARWVDLLVVDEDGEPVAGAKVFWHDPEAIRRVQADFDLSSLEQSIVCSEPEATARQHGWTAVADANGRARIAIASGYQIAASTSAPERYGLLSLPHGAPVTRAEYQLVLGADESVHVQVVDANDRPCADVPIRLLLFAHGKPADHALERPVADLTDELGRATIRHVQRLRNSARSASDFELEQAHAYVQLPLPGNNERGTRFDLQAPPDPVVVRMPACGSVRLRAALPSVTVTPKDLLRLWSRPDGQFYSGYACRPRADGWAVFPHVPIGKQLTAQTFGSYGFERSFAGPMRTGETVDFVVTAPVDATILTARLCDADGEPMRRRRFELKFPDNPRLFAQIMPTDREGHTFVIIHNRRNQPIAFERACIKLRDHGSQQPAKAWIGPIRTGSGITALGDVRMTREPVVAAGKLVLQGQPYLDPVRFSVQRMRPGVAGKPSSWQFVGMLACVRDGKGGFELRGELSAGRYRVYPWGGDLRRHGPTTFELGQRNLVIELTKGCALVVDLLLPEVDLQDRLEFRLTRAGTSRGSGFADEAPGWCADVSQCPDHRGFATWRGLTPGSYDLTARLWGASQPLLTIDNIAVPAASEAPPVQPIDLRALTQVITIEASLANGEPLYRPGRLVCRDQLAHDTCRGFYLHERTTRLLLPSGDVDLLALYPGLRPVPLRGAGPRFQATFHSMPTVKLHVPERQDKPHARGLPFVMIEYELGPAHRHRGTCETLYDSNPMDKLMGSVSKQEHFVGDSLDLRIGSGPHRLRAWLTHGDWRTEIRGIKPKLVTAADAEVHVTFDEAGWQAARDAFAKHIK